MTSQQPAQVGQTTITNTRVSPGDPPMPMANPAGQAFVFAVLVVDRTVNGGLNSLTQADSLAVSIDYSDDNGATWKTIARPVWQGGTWSSSKPGGPSIQHNSESLGINDGDRGFFPTDLFRISTVATAAVRISGTLTYFA